MNLVGALPPAPLRRADAETIRACDDVDSLIVVGNTSIHPRRSHHGDPATEAVALVNGTVRALEFDGSRWSEEVLRRDADRQDHLEAALQWSAPE